MMTVGILLSQLINLPYDTELYLSVYDDITEECVPLTGIGNYDGKTILSSMYMRHSKFDNTNTIKQLKEIIKELEDK